MERYGITCAGCSTFPEFDSDIVWIEKIRWGAGFCDRELRRSEDERRGDDAMTTTTTTSEKKGSRWGGEFSGPIRDLYTRLHPTCDASYDKLHPKPGSIASRSARVTFLKILFIRICHEKWMDEMHKVLPIIYLFYW